jgi:two-component system cell cycle response regulator PopA
MVFGALPLVRLTVRSFDALPAFALQQTVTATGREAQIVFGYGLSPEGEDIAIVDADPARAAEARAIAEALRAQDETPLLVLAATRSDSPPPEGFDRADALFDATLADDVSPAAFGRQLERAQRMATGKFELAMRRATARTLGCADPAGAAARKLKLLYVGAPLPAYLSLERWVQGHGGSLSAAFTSFSGFDHLHDEAFDALVVNAVNDPATALSICGALRRNAGLYHLPTCLLTASEDNATRQAAFEKGAAVAAAAEDPKALSWLFEAIRLERTRSAIDRGLLAYRDVMSAPRTGVFRAEAFRAHLDTLAQEHIHRARVLSLLALKIGPAFGARPPGAQTLSRAIAEAAALAGRLLRASDSPALIGDVFVAALPNTTLAGAQRTAERISAVADCTTFAAEDGSAGPLSFAQSVVQQEPGECAASVLARLLAPFDEKAMTA